MSATLVTTPAGWYHDPSDSGAWRWWDGATWTAHVRPKEEAAQIWRSASAEVVPIQSHSAATFHGDTRADLGGRSTRAMRVWVELGSAQTVGVWLLASLPLLSIALQFGLDTAFAAIQGATGTLGNIPYIAFIVILIASAWIFAGLDVRGLRNRGYDPPSLGWMLLLPPLAYFIRRGRVVRRQGKRAWPPELLYFLSVIGIMGVGAWYVALLMTTSGGIYGIIALAGSLGI